MAVKRKQQTFTVGFVVTMWLDEEIVAADITEALAKAKEYGFSDLVTAPGSVNDASVYVAGVTDMSVIDKVNS